MKKDEEGNAEGLDGEETAEGGGDGETSRGGGDPALSARRIQNPTVFLSLLAISPQADSSCGNIRRDLFQWTGHDFYQGCYKLGSHFDKCRNKLGDYVEM
ncbi:hypothetical protein TNCV_1679001 [Trichonephila clavipes]|nr:hypothetical protein TNCV_1679001 [Trichonephila clavipes]